MLHVSCRKFSQLSNSENFLKICQQIDKVTICNAMSYFFKHFVHIGGSRIFVLGAGRAFGFWGGGVPLLKGEGSVPPNRAKSSSY